MNEPKFNRDILEAEYKDPIITEETIKGIKSQAGRVYSNKEFEERSEKLLSTELPGKSRYIRYRSKKHRSKNRHR